MKTENELRELDAWIAEHLFSWKPTYAVRKGDLYYRPGGHGYTNRLYDAGCYSLEEGKRELVRGEPMDLVPHERPSYTTDPAAAMLVLEKCADDASSPIEISHEFYPWEIRTRVSNKPGDFLEVHADTLPLAICKFAKELFK